MPREACGPHDRPVLGVPGRGDARRTAAVLARLRCSGPARHRRAVATRWDDLPALIPGRVDYRIMIGPGRVVASYAVEAQLARDGADIGTDGLPLDDPS
jgi:hypothetical protein